MERMNKHDFLEFCKSPEAFTHYHLEHGKIIEQHIELFHDDLEYLAVVYQAMEKVHSYGISPLLKEILFPATLTVQIQDDKVLKAFQGNRELTPEHFSLIKLDGYYDTIPGKALRNTSRKHPEKVFSVQVFRESYSLYYGIDPTFLQDLLADLKSVF